MPRKPAISATLILILLVAWTLLTIQIGAAWLGHQDANGAWISVAVRNYQWHGFFTLGGLVDTSTNPLGPATPYIHHPPLVVWLSAFPVLLTGYSEALLRFVTACCTLLSTAAIYVLARRLAGRKYALWSAAFYMLTPMMAYFGRIPDHEPLALLLCLLFAAVLVNWLRRPTRCEWWALVALMILQVWTAWGGLIVMGALLVTAFFFTEKRLSVLMVGVAALGALIGLLGYYAYFFNNTISDLISTFIWRTSMNSLDPGTVDFGWSEYLLRVSVRLIMLFTPTIFLLGLLGAVLALRRSGLLRAMAVAFTAGGIAFLLLFRNASFIHDYYLIYLAPALALFAAYAILSVAYKPRYVRAFAVSFALMTVLPLLLYLHFLYSGSSDSAFLQIGQVVHKETEPQDLIVSNLSNMGMNIEFYAERSIEWGIAPASALDEAARFNGAAYYLYCGSASTPPEDIPRLAEVEISPQCSLIRLR